VRLIACLGLVLMLTACAATNDRQKPIGPIGTVSPSISSDAMIMDDGARLPLRAWLPEGKPRAVILALHGFNDYSKAFEKPGKEWAKHGVATYAYDQRGFGQAPDRGRWVGTRRLDTDLAEASRLLRARYPGVPLYMLGESMGGAVVMTAVTGAAGAPKPVCDGIVLVAPAVWGRVTMSVFERVALWAADGVAPDMTLTGRGLNITPSDNRPMLRALWRDPLVIKATRVDTIKGLVDLMDLALASATKLKGVPLMLLYGQHDEIVPHAPTRLFIAGLARGERAESRIALYEHGYHMLLRDLDAAIVIGDIDAWIGDHRAALPSGADRRAREGVDAKG
jgi:acylglycerol lipase